MGNVVEVVERYMLSQPDNPALTEWDAQGREKSLTYGALGKKTRALSAELAKCGIHKGDRVLLLVPMGLDLYVCILAIIRMGAVCVFVDPHMGAGPFEACCASVKPKAFIGVPKAHLFRLFSKSLRRVRVQFTTGALPRWLARNLQDGLRVTPADESFYPPVPMEEDDSALITFTTGSSGPPKGSDRTHGFLRGQLKALDALEKTACASDFPGFPILPLEDLAKGRAIYLPRIVSGKVREADPEVLLAQLTRHTPEMMSGSPAYLEALADGALRRGRFMESIKLLFTGGAPITGSALEKLRRAWPAARIEVVYGSTEAEPVSSLDAAEILGECQDKCRRGLGCCVGYPVPSIFVRILPLDHRAHEASDLAETALPAGHVGEIVVRGPHVNTRYWDNPGAQRANKIKTPDGTWHRMGDAGYLDAKGRLWVVGRTHTAMGNPRHRQISGWKVLNDPAMEDWPCLFPYQAEIIADGFPEVRKSAYLESGGEFYLVVETKNSSEEVEGLKHRLSAALEFLPLKDILFHPRLPVDARHNSKVEYEQVKKWLSKRIPK